MSDLPAGLVNSINVAVSPAAKFEEFLKTRGMRLTQERALIVEEVFSTHEHFDAEELTERVSARKDGRASRATVYRCLEHLEEAGLLRKVARTNNREIYEHDYGYPQHDHLICNRCGKMTEFHNEEIRTLLEKVAGEYGFLLEGHRLEVNGLCDECRKPKKRNQKLDLL